MYQFVNRMQRHQQLYSDNELSLIMEEVRQTRCRQQNNIVHIHSVTSLGSQLLTLHSPLNSCLHPYYKLNYTLMFPSYVSLNNEMPLKTQCSTITKNPHLQVQFPHTHYHITNNPAHLPLPLLKKLKSSYH